MARAYSIFFLRAVRLCCSDNMTILLHSARIISQLRYCGRWLGSPTLISASCVGGRILTGRSGRTRQSSAIIWPTFPKSTAI
jgi:hypothetical protein